VDLLLRECMKVYYVQTWLQGQYYSVHNEIRNSCSFNIFTRNPTYIVVGILRFVQLNTFEAIFSLLS
jgi:hypothetical protein